MNLFERDICSKCGRNVRTDTDSMMHGWFTVSEGINTSISINEKTLCNACGRENIRREQNKDLYDRIEFLERENKKLVEKDLNECTITESDYADIYKSNPIKWFSCSNCKCDFPIDMTDINSPSGYCQVCGTKIKKVKNVFGID